MAELLSTETLPLHTDADGVIRIGDTRVTLDTLVNAFEQGSTAEEIVQRYTTLDLSDVYVTIGYYLRHQSFVQEYLQGRRERAERIKQANRSQQHTIRERLQARQVAARVQ